MPLSPLEIATGFPLEPDPVPAALPPTDLSPRAALEAAMLPALRSGRCAVAFSGGVDSSAILCVAVALARREGLPDPLAVTFYTPGARDEDAPYAEIVARHLKLRDWERVPVHHELDLLGELGRRTLRRYGLSWPTNPYSGVPLHQVGDGYVLLDGFDGDTIFMVWRARRLADLAARRARPDARDLKRLARLLAPRPLRVEHLMRREPVGLPWLRPDARREAERLWARYKSSEPRRWDRRMAWYAGLRWVRESVVVEALVAAEDGWTYVHPFLDPVFLSALARDGGWTGYGYRGQAMVALFGDVMPHEVATRRTKADGMEYYWGPETLAWARSWDGSGVDTAIVDPDALRAEWRKDRPSAYSEMLLQQAWLHADRELRQPVD